MNLEPLNDKTILLFAMTNYSNPQCGDIEEFHEDLNRIKYIKRLLGRFEKKGILKERLILNHIIIMGNVFTPIGTTRMLFLKIEKELHSALKTFLLFLNYLPENTYDVPEVDLRDIPIDLRIMEVLRSV